MSIRKNGLKLIRSNAKLKIIHRCMCRHKNTNNYHLHIHKLCIHVYARSIVRHTAKTQTGPPYFCIFSGCRTILTSMILLRNSNAYLSLFWFLQAVWDALPEDLFLDMRCQRKLRAVRECELWSLQFARGPSAAQNKQWLYRGTNCNSFSLGGVYQRQIFSRRGLLKSSR